MPVVVSEHGSQRIRERMKTPEQELVQRIDKRQCVLIATREEGGTPAQYIVVWDEIAQEPFLVIVEVFRGSRSIRTVYQTRHLHSRKHGVIVRQDHIEKAVHRLTSGNTRHQAQEEKPKQETSDDTGVRLLQIYLAIKVHGERPIRRVLEVISNTDFAQKFGTLENYLMWYLDNGSEEIPIPKHSNVWIHLRRKNKLDVLDSFCIQEPSYIE